MSEKVKALKINTHFFAEEKQRMYKWKYVHLKNHL